MGRSMRACMPHAQNPFQKRFARASDHFANSGAVEFVRFPRSTWTEVIRTFIDLPRGSGLDAVRVPFWSMAGRQALLLLISSNAVSGEFQVPQGHFSYKRLYGQVEG
jgi:hypothetical protein